MSTQIEQVAAQKLADASAGTLQQLRLLADLSQGFSQSLDIEETLNTAVHRICDYMDAEAASVFLMDENSQKLVCRASAGPVDVTDMEVNIDCSIVGRTFLSGICQLVKDARKDSDFVCYVDELTGFETKSVLCTPLIIGDKPIGVLQVLNKLEDELFSIRDRDVLRVLASPIALSIQNARLTLDFVEQKRLKKELTLARKLQRSLLPPRRRPPFPIVGTNLAAHEVSGDFYDYFQLDDDCIGFIIGDVSGKGLDASMLMVRASSLLRWISKDRLSPSEWITEANKELCKNASRGLFVCAAVGYYFPKSDTITWSNAGLPPVIYKKHNNSIQTWIADAPPLGISSEIHFPQQEINLNNGGLYFVTDGLTDARNADNQRLDVGGLTEYIQQVQAEASELRLGKIMTYVRRKQLNDDATILLIERRDHLHEESLLAIEFAANACELKKVREQANQVTKDVGFTTCEVQKLTLCLDEAVTNIIRHAYKNDQEGMIHLSMKRQNNTLVYYLRDFAPIVYDNNIRPRNLSKPLPGQMGINFIDSIMDSWEFATPKDGLGNLMIMKKELD